MVGAPTQAALAAAAVADSSAVTATTSSHECNAGPCVSGRGCTLVHTYYKAQYPVLLIVYWRKHRGAYSCRHLSWGVSSLQGLSGLRGSRLVAQAITNPRRGALEKITFSTNTNRALQSLCTEALRVNISGSATTFIM